MITCIRESDIIANTAHGDVPAWIQVNIVVKVGQVRVGCPDLAGRLIFGERDAVKTLHSWLALFHPYTPLPCEMLPILHDHLIVAMQQALLLVEGFSEFLCDELGERFVVIPVVHVACELRRVRCWRSQ